MNTTVVIREVRFIIEDELTQVYVAMDAYNDVPLGVQGWHHKTFPASKSIKDILEIMWGEKDDDPILWPLEVPR